jgi:hypothetical protein
MRAGRKPNKTIDMFWDRWAIVHVRFFNVVRELSEKRLVVLISRCSSWYRFAIRVAIANAINSPSYTFVLRPTPKAHSWIRSFPCCIRMPVLVSSVSPMVLHGLSVLLTIGVRFVMRSSKLQRYCSHSFWGGGRIPRYSEKGIVQGGSIGFRECTYVAFAMRCGWIGFARTVFRVKDVAGNVPDSDWKG